MNTNITATLSRKGKTVSTLFRQLPHDDKVVVGGKVRWGSGAMWLVVAVTTNEGMAR
jgi:hypothetical protein